MQILNILTFGLVAGILSFTVADEARTSRKQGPVHMLGYVNTTIEEIDAFDRQLCEKHGGSGAYDDHKENEEQFDKCMRNVQNEIMAEVFLADDGPMHLKPEDVYRKYCGKVPKFENCVKNLTDSMKTCLDISKHEGAEVIYNTASSVFRYLCEHDGLRIGTFISSGGDECMHSKSPDMLLCANHTLFKYVKDTIPNGAEVGGLGKIHLLVPDVKKCTVLKNFEVCAIDQLRGCPEQSTADLATSVFKIVNEVTTCNRLVKSKASSANVVDVLSITALTAFVSMRFV